MNSKRRSFESTLKCIRKIMYKIECWLQYLILFVVAETSFHWLPMIATLRTHLCLNCFYSNGFKNIAANLRTRYLCCIRKCHVMICNFIALRSQNKLFDLICSCLQKHPSVSCTYSKLQYKILYYNFEGHVQQQLYHMIVINLG